MVVKKSAGAVVVIGSEFRPGSVWNSMTNAISGGVFTSTVDCYSNLKFFFTCTSDHLTKNHFHTMKVVFDTMNGQLFYETGSYSMRISIFDFGSALIRVKKPSNSSLAFFATGISLLLSINTVPDISYLQTRLRLMM
jgi:hypothetical protein